MGKRFSTCIFMMILMSGIISPAETERFLPKPLHITAPPWMNYYFDNRPLGIPFTLSGAPATVTLLIVRDHSPARPARSGYLGWHYVNQVDTCEYISAPKQYSTGSNVVEWSGKNQEGVYVPSFYYSYVLWGYDHTSAGQPVSNYLRPFRGDRSVIVTNDKAASPLAIPIWYDAPRHFSASPEQTRKIRTKWIIGSDPDDSTMAETCSYTSWAENSSLALKPGDDQLFYIQTLKPGGDLILRQYRWVPNGEAVVQTIWGREGEVSYRTTIPADNAWYSGPVSDGLGYLFFTDADISGNGGESNIVYVDAESGDILTRRDLSSRWMDSDHGATGPTNLAFRSGWLLCTSPASCLFQMINPYGEYNDNAVLWENGNGDGIADKNSETNWNCGDLSAPPYVYGAAQTVNHYAIFPADGLSGASFGLFAQDGNGMGYYPLADNETNVTAMKIIDYGSPFDGMYYSGTSRTGENKGWKYVAQDYFEGHFADRGDSYPSIWYRSPQNGTVLSPDLKYQIQWISNFIDFVDIDYSTDGGLNWIPIITDVRGEGNSYLWTVPRISSSNCKIRITGRWYTGHDDFMLSTTVIGDGLFTISGLTVVSGRSDAAPLPFITASNHPNPFNPSTTIHYTLGMKGIVTITVYNAIGQQVMRRTIGLMDRGAHEFLFDGAGLTSGLYFYRIATGNAAAAGKMLMVR